MAEGDSKIRRLVKAIVLSLPVALLMAMMIMGGQPGPKEPLQLAGMTVATTLDPLDSRVLSANEVIRVQNSRILRVNLMKKPH
jgi:hypothetical protein